MAFSTSSIPCSPFFSTSSKLYPALTKDEIYAFHSMDRRLFTRLVLELKCNKNQSLRVMTLWIWLERASLSSSVVYTILEFPNKKIQALFDESLLCLKLVDHDSSIANISDIDLPLLKSLAKKMDIGPKFFVDNKTEVLSGMEKAFNEVCSKAFDDIIEKVSIKQKPKSSGDDDSLVIANGIELFTKVIDVVNIDDVKLSIPKAVVQTDSTIVHNTVHHGSMINTMPFLPMQDEVTEMLRLMKLSFRKEGEEIVPPDERTIFLTFSKGYPIPEMEVHDFFTRLMGDLVEEVRMQDVVNDEQPLYARLVLRDPRAISRILGGQTKAKFSINGKHVWARKYIHKSTTSKLITTPTANSAMSSPFI